MVKAADCLSYLLASEQRRPFACLLGCRLVAFCQKGRILPSFWVSLLVFVSCQCFQMVQAIPRLLWELGSTKPATSHMALGLLHSALRFAPEGSALSDVLDGLQPQLCPLYCSLLAPKPPKGVSKGAGAVAKAGKVVVPGPLAQLPTATQVKHCHSMALECLACLGEQIICGMLTQTMNTGFASTSV